MTAQTSSKPALSPKEARSTKAHYETASDQALTELRARFAESLEKATRAVERGYARQDDRRTYRTAPAYIAIIDTVLGERAEKGIVIYPQPSRYSVEYAERELPELRTTRELLVEERAHLMATADRMATDIRLSAARHAVIAAAEATNRALTEIDATIKRHVETLANADSYGIKEG